VEGDEDRLAARVHIHHGVKQGIDDEMRSVVLHAVKLRAVCFDAVQQADEWWGRQKGLRQTLRTEVAVGGKGPDAQLDQWAITIRFEDENT
jgi:hypothetical protein